MHLEGFPGLEPTSQTVPERNLIAEILFRAIRDILNVLQQEGDRLNRIEAIKWMRLDRAFKDKDADTPFSFVWCCNSLQLCPHIIKAKVKYMRDSGIKVVV